MNKKLSIEVEAEKEVASFLCLFFFFNAMALSAVSCGCLVSFSGDLIKLGSPDTACSEGDTLL